MPLTLGAVLVVCADFERTVLEADRVESRNVASLLQPAESTHSSCSKFSTSTRTTCTRYNSTRVRARSYVVKPTHVPVLPSGSTKSTFLSLNLVATKNSKFSSIFGISKVLRKRDEKGAYSHAILKFSTSKYSSTRTCTKFST